MVIGITNLKGGVGKTTISQNLAVCFAHMEYKVCIVDTDTNQNSLSWSGARSDDLPSVTVVGITNTKALTKTIKKLLEDYDIVIIDGTPSLSEMTTRIILSSDILIIPIRPGAHDFRTMDEFLIRYDQAKEFKEYIPALMLLNEYAESKQVHKGIKEMLASNYEIPLLKTTIKNRVAYAESSIVGEGVYEGIDNLAKKEMVDLTKEVLKEASKIGLIS